MKGECSLPTCGLKDGLNCDLGHFRPGDCTHFKSVSPQPVDVVGETSVEGDESGQRLPWTGRAFGLNDIMLVSARAPVSLIGLIGPFNSGKTTFLTSLFAHFSETGLVGKHSFAGSYTIDAWSRLKSYTEWPAAK